jgi:two-component system cell cycle response regulator DivK
MARTVCYEPTTRLLVADHDDENRSLLRAVLTMKGFEVLQAVDGEEALSLAIERRPALLLMDLRLPLMNGTRLIRRLRECGLRQIPIITTSLSETNSHHDPVLVEGSVAHIENPVELELLDDLLDRVLPGQRANLISVLVH